MDEAEVAYGLAHNEIQLAVESGSDGLSFRGREFEALREIPPQISDLKGLRVLEIEYTSIEDVSILGGLKQIKKLNLSNNPISNLWNSSDLTELEDLRLTSTKIFDIDVLKFSKKLRYLRLKDTEVYNLQPLSELYRLRELNISNTNVSDLTPISGLRQLRELWFYNTRVDDIRPLEGLTDIIYLGFEGANIKSLEPLRNFSELEGLWVANNQIFSIEPISHIKSIKRLDISGNQSLFDIRPVANMTNLIPVISDGTGLYFKEVGACAFDPLGLGVLADIQDNTERTTKTLRYLQDLKGWPPNLVPAPEQDSVLQVDLNEDGKLDLRPVRPQQEETDERLKRKLFARLLDAFADLERAAGNQQPDVSRRAREVLDRLPADFANADLIDVYLDVAWARAEFDRRGEREGEEPFSSAAVAALNEILTIGPGVLLDNPTVDTLEERRRRFAVDPLSPEASAAQNSLAKNIAEDPAAFGDTLRRYAAGSQNPTADPDERRSAVQRILTRNTVLALGEFVALAAIGGTIGNLSTDALRFGMTWLVENQAIIEVAAAGWGQMFLAWISPVFDNARVILAAVQAAGGTRPLPRTLRF